MCLLKSNDLPKIFKNLDLDGDGYVSMDELRWFLDKVDVRTGLDELELIIGQKNLDLQEFMYFCESIYNDKQEWEGEEEENELVEAFKVFDLNDDGFISCEELQCVLARLGLWEETGGCDCESMICKFDTNSDGLIDFQEFKNMMLLTIPSVQEHHDVANHSLEINNDDLSHSN